MKYEKRTGSKCPLSLWDEYPNYLNEYKFIIYTKRFIWLWKNARLINHSCLVYVIHQVKKNVVPKIQGLKTHLQIIHSVCFFLFSEIGLGRPRRPQTRSAIQAQDQQRAGHE